MKKSKEPTTKAMNSTLEKDIVAFEAEKAKLAAETGKYAVVYDGKLIGTFHTYQDALTAGYEVASLKPFLVRQITNVPQVQHFSRSLHLQACPILS